MADYDIGLHVVSEATATEHGESWDRVSIVEFCRQLRANDRLPLYVTVTGLDDFLEAADDTDAALSFLNGQLADAANHLVGENPVAQFVVDDIEHWQNEPVIRTDDDRIRLSLVFGGLEQQGANWYYSKLNVTS
jgi:hypothetical protein